ncbi:protein arginine kinase [Peribacillus loiseleuriae]|uniref:Protein-arginine kinase n=1 Tax=Peribacillus loiseleuriae TaxID=1679170 RepID=A0A0K9GNE0_9BACI|nr:protein arginine kinase [Peribacillus loiseleuriae]KMY48188.1 ATP:guanido phosphotransferase [Peribacillus loiseleuriae]
MTLDHFAQNAKSSWWNEAGPDADIVRSSRIRMARNFRDYKFPTIYNKEEANKIMELVKEKLEKSNDPVAGNLELFELEKLEPLERQVLVEKHLISPNLAEDSLYAACLLSKNEEVSIMVNEEEHIRIQCMVSGLQLTEALEVANKYDDWVEQQIDYAYDEERGYLTSCPTNVGTGLRASVMMHLPGLVLTRQINKIIPAINQLGLVVRGMYGEGSSAVGNIFQISNQITLGKSEKDIVEDLTSIVQQIIAQERSAREALVKTSHIQLEDRVYRSLGVLLNARIIESKEAATCISDVSLGIDLGYIKNIEKSVMNELMILTQPGFLQKYAGGPLQPYERDVRRASLIRERLDSAQIENS